MTKNRSSKQATRRTMAGTGDSYTRTRRLGPSAAPLEYTLGTRLTGGDVTTRPGSGNTQPLVAFFGGPGSGKTFLALQMIDQFLRHTAGLPDRVAVVTTGRWNDFGAIANDPRILLIRSEDPLSGHELLTFASDQQPKLVVLHDVFLTWDAAPHPSLTTAIERVIQLSRSTRTTVLLANQQLSSDVPSAFLECSTRVLMGSPSTSERAQRDWEALGGVGVRPPHPRHREGAPSAGIGWVASGAGEPQPFCARGCSEHART
jgi:hypothetical protein